MVTMYSECTFGCTNLLVIYLYIWFSYKINRSLWNLPASYLPVYVVSIQNQQITLNFCGSENLQACVNLNFKVLKADIFVDVWVCKKHTKHFRMLSLLGGSTGSWVSSPESLMWRRKHSAGDYFCRVPISRDHVTIATVLKTPTRSLTGRRYWWRESALSIVQMA